MKKDKNKQKFPWLKYYNEEDFNIEVGDLSIYQMLKESALEHLNVPAYNYFGKLVSYKDFLAQIDLTAKAFRSQGIRKGDVVTICMPNLPEGLISFYALNKIGAVANMIHPLSSEGEIKHYLQSTNSVMLVMIDICYDKVKDILKETDVYKVVIVSAKDSMNTVTGLGYAVTKGYKIKKVYKQEEYIYWKDFVRRAFYYNGTINEETTKDTPAVILHSGGTTGVPKGIALSNGNFNSLVRQAGNVLKKLEVGDVILGVMPIFHGFGLGVTMHAPFCLGLTVALVPQFDAKKFDKLLEKYNPNVLLGVPTLYEALSNTNNKKLNLSNLKYVISGGDSLTISLTRKINKYLRDHGALVDVTQGYGMTESLAAVALATEDYAKEGSIGIPFPGTYMKIVALNTQEEVPYGVDGEICISGPTVMLGYLDNEKETNDVLQIHKDGRIWLHTGDMGRMDEDGVIFYEQRLKRMIISSGYNVYPQQIENVIEEHEAVLKCTVIGIPHPYKMQVPKAFIVLKNGYDDTGSIKKSIKEHCKKNLSKFSLPYEYEFRDSLPKTLIGKVDLKKLAQEGRQENE